MEVKDDETFHILLNVAAVKYILLTFILKKYQPTSDIAIQAGDCSLVCPEYGQDDIETAETGVGTCFETPTYKLVCITFSGL